MPPQALSRKTFPRDLTIPFLLAAFQLALHITFHGSYNYFRDELYYIACSDHLAFGYVDQPPLCAAILWVTRHLLGDSLYAIRFLPALAGAAVVYLAALMTRKLGGGSFAQALAALSVVAAPVLIGQGKFFSMNPFDVLFWTLAGYVVLVILSDDRPKLWILFGCVAGLGLLNKYSMGFMVVGIVAGLLLTHQRKQLATKWFWIGATIAGVLFLPHVLWEVSNGFPSLEFMRNASENKNVNLGVIAFFTGQLMEMNVFNAPLWLSGIAFFFFSRDERLRPLAWMYPAVFVVMVAGNAKVYYLAAIYPLFLAGGAVAFERWFQNHPWRWARRAYMTSLIVYAVIALPFALPVLPAGQFVEYEKLLGLAPHAEERTSVAELPQYYADQFGWEEFVATVATIYKRLTPEEQAECFIFVRNYGEAGAIDFFGKRYGLPNAQCGHNSYWMWGPGKRTGNIAIIVGGSRTLQDNLNDLNRRYAHVELGGTTYAKYAMPFENGRLIFLCKGMKTTFQKLWPGERFYI
ncbi:MAG: glycosyltransferase family 39 protein [Ignavibacteriales bacterium]|nr:glycosyltransferase family 39 protein [Ignavibacteriales bacterium]